MSPLTRDPSYSRIDLISYRNLLIYMDIYLPGVVLPTLRQACVKPFRTEDSVTRPVALLGSH
jgi:hypothetical protein